jgi:uncharacterized protein (TIGR02996 family)
MTETLLRVNSLYAALDAAPDDATIRLVLADLMSS